MTLQQNSKIQKEKKKEKRKKVKMFVLGSFVVLLGIAQLLITINNFFFTEQEHNKIILENRIMTTEVCTQWFEYSVIEQEQVYEFEFHEGLKKYLIPKEILIEVCTKWKIIKDRIDNETKPKVIVMNRVER